MLLYKRHAYVRARTCTRTCGQIKWENEIGNACLSNEFWSYRPLICIGQSKAKSCKEFAGDVGIGVAPQKPSQNTEKREKFRYKMFFNIEKNKMSGIVRNAFSQSFDANAADFKG